MNETDRLALNAMLVRAAKHDKQELAKEVFGQGAYVDARDGKERTVLHWFAMHVNADMLLFFIEKGADVNAADELKWTPLHHAAYWGGSIACMKLLIEHGADLDLKDVFGHTPLDTLKTEYSTRHTIHSDELTVLDLNVKKLKKEDIKGTADTGYEFDI